MKHTLILMNNNVHMSRTVTFSIPDLIQKCYSHLRKKGSKHELIPNKSVRIIETRHYIVNVYSGMSYDTEAKAFNKKSWEDVDGIFEKENLEMIMKLNPKKFVGCTIIPRLVDVTDLFAL